MQLTDYQSKQLTGLTNEPMTNEPKKATDKQACACISMAFNSS